MKPKTETRFRVAVLAGLLGLMLMLPGCSARSTSSDTITTAKKRISIGVTIMDLNNPYFNQLFEGIKAAADRENIFIVPNDAQSRLQSQLDALDYFISVPVDAIIIAALDQNVVEPYLARARKQGIKVVAQATKVENCDILIGFEEWDMGHVLGTEAGAWMKRHQHNNPLVALVGYDPISRLKIREKGIMDGLREQIPGTRLAGRYSAATPEQGKAAAAILFREHPDVDMVLAINDGGALGVLAYVQEKHPVDPDFFIGGIDATPEARAAIKTNSWFRCTVDIQPFESGEIDVAFAQRLLQGKSVPDHYGAVPRAIIQGAQ